MILLAHKAILTSVIIITVIAALDLTRFYRKNIFPRLNLFIVSTGLSVILLGYHFYFYLRDISIFLKYNWQVFYDSLTYNYIFLIVEFALIMLNLILLYLAIKKIRISIR